MSAPKYKPAYVTVSNSITGWMAVLICRDDLGIEEPWQTGFGKYATPEEAWAEAEDWAMAEGLECKR